MLSIDFRRAAAAHRLALPLLAILCAVCAVSARATDSTATPAKWGALLWHDEFDQPVGSGPDESRWTYALGDSGWGNAELQCYTDSRENSLVAADPEAGDGRVLVIRALRDEVGRTTSARITTRGKFAVKFGRIEARLKVPKGQGIWPAFWMLGENEAEHGWPHCGEIDVMELLGHEPERVYGSLHGPGYSGIDSLTGSVRHAAMGGQSPEGDSGESIVADFSSAYHVFAVEWRPGRIEWFCDGLRYHVVDESELPEGAHWVFDETPHFLLLNLAVGGKWPGYPDDTTEFPQEYRIDYVRVYAAQD
ncbi:hypothetical protein AXK11_06435 [Cephaloticoccus primus]|uniref:GH16 domain-containing protein n=1 Tax=Cephaloticoccus primus TaxID=1548207 RepID=A0A139SLI7_9BACT|nr:glycoside hydrolase family 16 protein [Cephaloticoccus primus]KXU35415.1 hypothetical protein AXK11_06435 [Cephaloticoccus primus]